MTATAAPAALADGGRLLGGLAPDVRRSIMDALADGAIGYELHRWRAAVRGDAPGELSMLRALDLARVGTAAPELSVADELDRRLTEFRSPPAHPGSPAPQLKEWASRPDDAERARRWARAQSAAGPNPAASYPGVLDRESEDGSSVAEAALIVLADAVALASRRPGVEAVDAARRLAAVEARFGRVVPPGAAGTEVPAGEEDGSADESGDTGTATGPAPVGDLPLADLLARTDTDVAAAYAAHREGVLALLLRGLLRPGRPAADDALRQPAAPGPPARLERLRRVAIGVAISVAFTALLVVLPRALPGRLPDSELTPHSGPVCATCAPDARLVAMGWQSSQQRVTVTVRLGGPPKPGSILSVGFAGTTSLLDAHRTGSRWSAAMTGPAPFSAKRVQVLSKGSVVVIVLPASARTTGIGVATSRDRLPAHGMVPPQPGPAASFTIVDVLIVALLVIAGIRGFRRGFVATVPVLAGFVLNLVVARALYPPLGALLLDHLTHIPRIADSLAVGLLTSVIGIAVYLLAGTASSRATAKLVPKVGLQPSSPTDRRIGALARVLRATASAATLLTLLVNLAAVSTVATLVTNSVLARGAIDIWRHVYPGL